MSRLSRRQLVRRGAGLLGLGAPVVNLLAACAAPSTPPPARTYHIGWLDGSTAAVRAADLEVFRQTLRELGYVEGQNLVIEYRWGEGQEPTPDAAAELARLPVDVFVVVSTIVAHLAREATSTIPIVSSSGDLVVAGLAASYARPRGNVTGVSDLARELSSKRLQLLKETAPTASRVAVLLDTSPGMTSQLIPELERDARSF